MKYSKSLILILFLGSTLGIYCFDGIIAEPDSTRTIMYYPDKEWRKETPESLGLDPAKLESMNQTIITQDIGIDSIHIIRYGYLGYEMNYDYYTHSDIHLMWSVTKSVISILIGIAHEEGFIPSLDEPILDIFTERSFDNVDSRKEAITIRHLLKMQSGLEWSSINVMKNDPVDKHDYELLTNSSDPNWNSWPMNPDHDTVKMFNSSDWVQYILDKPMVSNPGTEFFYSTAPSHLLSAVIQNKTGMNTVSFAEQYLFNHLGITNYVWYNDSQGISNGGLGLWLQPFDMTKIGYLYLNEGQWNNVQVVPSSWVSESIQDYNPGNGYGYQWWIKDNYYHAIGHGGQNIYVVPDDSLVTTITASEYPHYGNIQAVFEGFILSSIIADITFPTTTTTRTTTTTTSDLPSVTLSDKPESTTTTTQQSTNLTSFLIILTFTTFTIYQRKKN